MRVIRRFWLGLLLVSAALLLIGKNATVTVCHSRTRDLAGGFARSLAGADRLYLLDIYPAREEPIQGVNGELIANAAKEFGHKQVHYVPDKKAVPAFLLSIVQPGDIVITMGAGDIWRFGEDFIAQLKAR